LAPDPVFPDFLFIAFRRQASIPLHSLNPDEDFPAAEPPAEGPQDTEELEARLLVVPVNRSLLSQVLPTLRIQPALIKANSYYLILT
jgi:hypothetical protein